MKKIGFFVSVFFISMSFAQNNISDNTNTQISKYAVYEISEPNQRLVKPELIEKYRRSRNNNTYVNLYPTDWEGIRKDQGLKLVSVKQKKTKTKNHSSRNRANSQPSYYRPKGWFLSPVVSYGWNSRNGWNPLMGVVVGNRNPWLPSSVITWSPKNGMSWGVNSPVGYYQNIYNQPYYNAYNVNPYMFQPYMYQPNNYSNPQTNVNTPSQQPMIVQAATIDNNDVLTRNISENDWSNGIGGPEKYLSKSKKISDYTLK